MDSTSTIKQSNVLVSARRRYFKLALLVIVAGNIYPLMYLRQNFQVSMLEVFEMTSTQLGQNYAILGVLYMVSYIPSGWLADRISLHVLMSFSLAMAGILGAWFASIPSFEATQIIFAGWGIAAGLTFWAALIKATAVLAEPHEQGRFFGILEGGRGLVEALLATIAVGIFAWATQSAGESTADGLKKVIWMYASCMLVLAPVTYYTLQERHVSNLPDTRLLSNFVDDLTVVATNKDVWLCAICILTGYQLYWATYSFSAYLQNFFGMTAVAVGAFTVAKLWMRPIGGVVAGFLGDFTDLEALLGSLLLAGSVSLAAMIFLPISVAPAVMLAVIMAVGLLTYAVRGIYWSTLDRCGVSNNIKGLAIGLISIIGFSPDIYLPLLESYLVSTFPGRLAYTIYFGLIAACGVLGAAAAMQLRQRVSARLN